MPPPAHNLTEGSISKRLLLFTLPILIGNILQSLNATVNSFWIGHYLGEAALTASSNAGNVLFLLLGAMFGASMAATILIGQYLGGKRLHDAKRVVGTSTTFALALSVCMAVIGWVICEPLLRAMQTPPEALPLAIAYMRVIFLALPFMVLYIFATSALRGAGDAKTPLYFLLLSVGLDIGLNPVFIFGVGPIPHLGIAGSAVATLVAQAISLGVLLSYLYAKKHPLCLHGDEIQLLRIDWSIVGTLIGKGVPMALQMMVLSFSMLLMITLVNRFGIHTAAAYGAALQLWNYIQMPSYAIGMAVSSMAAQNIGAQKWDRISSITRMGMLYQLILTGTMVLIVDVFCRSALGLWLTPGSLAMEIGVRMNYIITWSFVFFGISMVLFGVVRANGAVVAPLIVLAISLLGIRIPLAWGLALFDGAQPNAIWWSFPVSSFVAILMAMGYYKWGKWRTYRMISPQTAAAQAAAAAAASAEVG